MDNQKRKMPIVDLEALKKRPRPRAVVAADVHENRARDRIEQADVDLVEVLLTHRADLDSLRKLYDAGRLEQVRKEIDVFIALADQELAERRS